jgi:hypothetical protein
VGAADGFTYCKPTLDGPWYKVNGTCCATGIKVTFNGTFLASRRDNKVYAKDSWCAPALLFGFVCQLLFCVAQLCSLQDARPMAAVVGAAWLRCVPASRALTRSVYEVLRVAQAMLPEPAALAQPEAVLGRSHSHLAATAEALNNGLHCRACRLAAYRDLPNSCCSKDIDELPDGTALVVGAGEDSIWYRPTWFSSSTNFMQVRPARVLLFEPRGLLAPTRLPIWSARAARYRVGAATAPQISSDKFTRVKGLRDGTLVTVAANGLLWVRRGPLSSSPNATGAFTMVSVARLLRTWQFCRLPGVPC